MDVGEIEDGGEYVDVTFATGSLHERVVTGARFDGCRFVGVDASLARLPGCRLSEVRWEGVKLVGTDWTVLDWPTFGLHTALEFTGCQLDYAVFARLQLRGSRFVDCRLREATFAEADLRETVFHHSDLTSTDLQAADLRDADLSGATGYLVDPASTRVEGLKVSHPEAESFLVGLGLVVVDRPDHPDLPGVDVG